MSEQKVVKEYPPDRRITLAMPFKRYLGIPQISIDAFTRFNEVGEALARGGNEVKIVTDITTANTPVTRMHIVNTMVGDWLIMMDADAFPISPDAGVRLLEVAREDPKNLKKIVAVPAVRTEYPYPSAFGTFNEEGMAIPYVFGIDFDEAEVKATEKKLAEVDWTGFHMVLIHRTVFEKVAFPWFQIGVVDEESGITYGHDIRFCRLAKRAGFDIHVDFSIIVGHESMKPVTLIDQMMVQKTSPLARNQFKQYAVDPESLKDDEGVPLNYVIPDPSGETKGRSLSETVVNMTDDVIFPKEAME